MAELGLDVGRREGVSIAQLSFYIPSTSLLQLWPGVIDPPFYRSQTRLTTHHTRYTFPQMLAETIPSTALKGVCCEDELIEPEFDCLGFNPGKTVYKGQEIR